MYLLGWDELFWVIFEVQGVFRPESGTVLQRPIGEFRSDLLPLEFHFVDFRDSLEGLFFGRLQLNLDVRPVPNARLDVARSGHCLNLIPFACRNKKSLIYQKGKSIIPHMG